MAHAADPSGSAEHEARRSGVELGAYWTRSFVAHTPSRNGLGFLVDYELTPRIRLGIDAAFYVPFEESGATWPAEAGPMQMRASGAIDVTYVPFRARSEHASIEVYVVGGPGVVSTRPIAVVDPVNRAFSYSANLAFHMGVGARVSLHRSVVLGIEMRDTMYNQVLENSHVADGSSGFSPADPATWSGGHRLTHVLQTRLGLTLLL